MCKDRYIMNIYTFSDPARSTKQNLDFFVQSVSVSICVNDIVNTACDLDDVLFIFVSADILLLFAVFIKLNNSPLSRTYISFKFSTNTAFECLCCRIINFFCFFFFFTLSTRMII